MYLFVFILSFFGDALNFTFKEFLIDFYPPAKLLRGTHLRSLVYNLCVRKGSLLSCHESVLDHSNHRAISTIKSLSAEAVTTFSLEICKQTSLRHKIRGRFSSRIKPNKIPPSRD
jgi:hypothetical protein